MEKAKNKNVLDFEAHLTSVADNYPFVQVLDEAGKVVN